MRYEWDWRKAEANYAKHGIQFEDAIGAFLDERGLHKADNSSEEERAIVIGMDNLGRLVVLVYTWRREAIRLISARRATRTETRWYAAGEP